MKKEATKIPISEERLTALEAVAQAATPGPWAVYHETHESFLPASRLPVDEYRIGTKQDHPQLGMPAPVVSRSQSSYYAQETIVEMSPEDAAFIAASREALPVLLAEVRRLRTLAFVLREALDDAHNLLTGSRDPIVQIALNFLQDGLAHDVDGPEILD